MHTRNTVRDDNPDMIHTRNTVIDEDTNIRGCRGNPRSILGVIMDVTDMDQYKIAVKYGVLKGHYSRNQFDLCPHKLLTKNDVNTESMISLREAVVRQSASGGQGFVKCNCIVELRNAQLTYANV